MARTSQKISRAECAFKKLILNLKGGIATLDYALDLLKNE